METEVEVENNNLSDAGINNPSIDKSNDVEIEVDENITERNHEIMTFEKEYVY